MTLMPEIHAETKQSDKERMAVMEKPILQKSATCSDHVS
jgi:hypothetical protein